MLSPGCTPLHWAAIRGKSEAATVLLQVKEVIVIEIRIELFHIAHCVSCSILAIQDLKHMND